MNIVIPMAGRGIRTSNFPVPKPLIKFGKKTMIEMAVESLDLDGNYIFIQRDYQNDEWNSELERVTKNLVPDCKIIRINYVTEGPACSALLATPLIANTKRLLITNCDQIMRWNSSKFQGFLTETDADGIVVTYPADTPKNSYVKLNEQGFATQFAEKQVISTHSLNGIHFWKEGAMFVQSAMEMIHHNDSVNDEYYIAPTYNYMLPKHHIGIYEIPVSEHFAVGTNDDISRYMQEAL